jgi:hypothetical protein
VVGAQFLDAAQLHADPALALREVGGSPAVLPARPERHAVGLAQDTHDVVEGALLLRVIGDALCDSLEREYVGILEVRRLPWAIGLGFWTADRRSRTAQTGRRPTQVR